VFDRPGAGPLLSLECVNKSFPGVRALTDVSLQVDPGEVHALVGENGAGKSTLMSIASGSLAPDSGSVHIQGKALRTTSPRMAQELGLAIVRQIPALLPQLTVTENMELMRGTKWIASRARSREWVNSWLEPWQLDIDPRSRLEDLSVEHRQVIEIARALAMQPKVLILDEPTEHLNVEESERLFDQIRRLVGAGGAVIYISHRIPEVKLIADRITVLRDGEARGTFRSDDVDENMIVARVIGRELNTAFPVKPEATSILQGGLEIQDFRGEGFGTVDLHVRPGEIVGLAGVQGNGQSKFLRGIAGVHATSGVLRVNHRSIRTGSPTSATDAGVAFIPADRHNEGVFLPLDVQQNIAFGDLSQVSRAGWVSQARVHALAAQAASRFEVKTPGLTTPVRALSGGNQQKILFARTSLAKPTVLLVEEPTQGVDAGARVEIYSILREAADGGAAVIVLSSDNIELSGLCERVVIFSRGQVISELTGDAISEEAITTAALSSTSVRTRHQTVRRIFAPPAWLRGDYTPSLVLALIAVVLGAYVASQDEFFLTTRNLTPLLALLAPLALVAVAQTTAMLGGGLDLSVGPLSGFLLVVASFYVIDDVPAGWLVLGFVLIAVLALGVGTANGAMVQWLKINAVIATLVMFMLLRGVSLTLREIPDGAIDEGVVKFVGHRIGPVPASIVVTIAFVLLLEVLLRRSRAGMALRAIGSDVDAAAAVGIKVARVRFLSFAVTSVLVIPVALLLMVQVGIGDPATGVTYTLASITAAVLGGVRVMGGRGSYVGAFFGALLITEVQSATTFLGLGSAWQYWLMGALLLGAAVLFTRVGVTRTLV